MEILTDDERSDICQWNFQSRWWSVSGIWKEVWSKNEEDKRKVRGFRLCRQQINPHFCTIRWIPLYGWRRQMAQISCKWQKCTGKAVPDIPEQGEMKKSLGKGAGACENYPIIQVCVMQINPYILKFPAEPWCGTVQDDKKLSCSR